MFYLFFVILVLYIGYSLGMELGGHWLYGALGVVVAYGALFVWQRQLLSYNKRRFPTMRTLLPFILLAGVASGCGAMSQPSLSLENPWVLGGILFFIMVIIMAITLVLCFGACLFASKISSRRLWRKYSKAPERTFRREEDDLLFCYRLVNGRAIYTCPATEVHQDADAILELVRLDEETLHATCRFCNTRWGYLPANP